MLKASENFKLLKTVVIAGMPYFLIEHQGKEYFSFRDVFVRNTDENRRELIEQGRCWWFDFKKAYKQLLNSPLVSGWEVVTDGYHCFEGCQLPIGHWDIDLPNLEYAGSMFAGCKTLTCFSGNLDSLESGSFMFCRSGLILFETHLPSLRGGEDMFAICKQLTTFNVPLPRLENGERMFKHSSLETFYSSTPNLKHDIGMFRDTPLEASSKPSLQTA